MSQYRVIVVDDEILVRQGLSARLSGSPDMKIVGVCSNGPALLDRLAAGAADAVVLDLEIQCSDAQMVLKKIRESYPDILVLSIAPSESSTRRIPAALLTPGRSEAIVRPGQATTAEAFLDDLALQVRKRLLEMLRASDRAKSNSVAFEIAPESKSALSSSISNQRSGVFAVAPEARSGLRSSPGISKESASIDSILASSSDSLSIRVPAPETGPTRSLKRVEILAIASSTGGPQALTELLGAIPADFPVPIVIVQHMPAEFTKNLADRLDASCPIEIREAAAGDVLQPGLALIAPGNFHMTLLKGEQRRMSIALNQGPVENSCRPAADVLFRSVADIYGPAALGVVLTGMGKDGLAGTKVIREAGGRVIVQDEASSVVWGMPGEIARAGLADAVLPLRELPGEILRRVTVGRI